MSHWLLILRTQKRLKSPRFCSALRSILVLKSSSEKNGQKILKKTYLENFTEENLIQLIYVWIRLARGLWRLLFWHAFGLRAKSVSWGQEHKIFFFVLLNALSYLSFFILQKFDNLRDVGVVPLTGELEDLVDILSGWAVASGVLILVLYVDFYLQNLLVLVLFFRVWDLYTLTQRMVQSDLIYKLLKHGLRDMFVSHCVPRHLQLIKIGLCSDDISRQWLIINQMDSQSKVQLYLLEQR